jgi:hypothetical protein
VTLVVDQQVLCDLEEPRSERSRGIVSVARAMDAKE